MTTSQDVKDHIPDTPIVDAIYAHYKKVGDSEPQRGYLGASIIGHPCERYLWYNFRQCCSEDVSGRTYRLWETGDLEEVRLSKDLQAIGCAVFDTDGEGEQFEVSALGGHFSGHLDGCARGIPGAKKTWHVMEYKTHKDKSFRHLLKYGVEKSKPQHYAQMQSYMHLTGMKRGLYLARNKDTDEIYAERVKYHKAFCDDLMAKAERIITASEPPPRLNEKRDYYLCSWCDANDICFGTEGLSPKPALPLKTVSCRQCCHATPIIDGTAARWNCSMAKAPMLADAGPCKDHLCLPGLFAFAEIDCCIRSQGGDANVIVMKNSDGETWLHGNDTNSYSTTDLLTLPADLLTSGIVSDVKELFGGKMTFSRNPLEKYSEENSDVLWKGPASKLSDAWLLAFQTDLGTKIPIERYGNLPEYDAAEMEGEILVIVWGNGTGEIREKVR